MITTETKMILAQSLTDLARKKCIDTISVSDITRNCGASRQTFYNYFKDKNDLINWIFKIKSDRIFDAYSIHKSWYECIRQEFLMLNEEGYFFEKVSKMNPSTYSGQNPFFDYLIQYTQDYYLSFLAKSYGKEEITNPLIHAIEFNSYGAAYSCIKWIKSNMTNSADSMAELQMDNMPTNLKKYFSR